MMTLAEINRLGYRALIDSLGFDGAIKFLRQFDSGEGDYTKQRQQWLDKLTLEDIVADIERRRT